jgi:16S rRNA C1402 N4-methylase RsmH
VGSPQTDQQAGFQDAERTVCGIIIPEIAKNKRSRSAKLYVYEKK